VAKQFHGASFGATFFVRTLVAKPFPMRQTHHWVSNKGSKRIPPGNPFKMKDVTIGEPTWTQLREDVVDVFYISLFFSAHGVFCNTRSEIEFPDHDIYHLGWRTKTSSPARVLGWDAEFSPKFPK